nr:type II toxin-antitoxin system RelE/ParE family toxin [Wohlfahrtiimonas chitiniclastica]
MDKQNARRIVDTLEQRIAVLDDPRVSGKALKGNLGDLWHYRIGDYRVLCDIQDGELIILAALIGGHRKDIYD